MSPNKSFNDVIEHKQKVEGAPITRGGRLPLPIKIIGYFLFGGMAIMIVLSMIANYIF
ncbi:hypothetical protein [Gracilibacillus thailandensis]|uniref:hypothetical protein n=1 Tax=Gracilibacillus thailandensis TaxID=563735 RepID=UPI0013D0942E|nr:hypothetical protein [Gracilibacillus thailandensis]